MKTSICLLSALMVVLAAGVDRTPALKEIMRRLHVGPGSHLSRLRKTLMGESTDWPLVQEQAREVARLGDALSANNPPRGDAAQFRALARNYAATARVLGAAAQSHHRTQALFALNKLGMSCQTCHESHKSK